MNKSSRIQSFVQLPFFVAVMTVMWLVPFLGYIPLGFTRATIIHIPVIIGSIIMGPKKGAILGLFFGITSFITNTISPTITSFVFTPFYSLAGFESGFESLIVCFIPRILVGVLPYFIYKFSSIIFNKSRCRSFPLLISGFLGSLTNTLLVMSFILLFFGDSYSGANNIAIEGLGSFILSIIIINGIPEMIVAGILTFYVGSVLIGKTNKSLKLRS